VGIVQGQVTWAGTVPVIPPYRAPVSPLSEQAGGAKHTWANPNAVVVDAATHGVAHAVVFLRGIEPGRGRPWDHPPVRVQMRDYQYHILQGDADSRTGFVRRGASFTMESAQPRFHSLVARGSAFFALPFPNPSQPCTRRLDRRGVVELTSGAGYFWMRAHLFVDDHPYYTRTDATGRFVLSQVPPGDYDLVCWLPNWLEGEHELDADTGLIYRLQFRPPVQVVQPVRLGPGAMSTASFTISLADFGR
jgi:hypothetical protein